MKFINREEELKQFEELYNSDNFEFLSLIGRRRIGKTELIKKFLEERDGVYLYVSVGDDKQLRLHIAEVLNKELNLSFIGEPSWREIIKKLFSYTQEKKLFVVFDEFQRFLEINKSVPSLIQEAIDKYKNSSKMFLCVSGSSIGMIERMFDYSAPLYGRRTGRLKLRPFDYENVRKWLKEDEEKMVNKYAVFGGTPKYLEFVQKDSIIENITKAILSPNSLLYDEPFVLLATELKTPDEYLDILKFISMGKETAKEITDQLDLERTSLNYYINNLERNMNLIRKIVPVTEKVSKSRKTRYKLNDNFFRFWFRFVYPQKDQLELGNLEGVEQKIKEELNSYVGRVYEEIIREIVRKKNGENLLDWRLKKYEKVGAWWNRKGEEIDICGISKKDTLLGEVKWGKIDLTQAKELLNKMRECELKKKSQYLIVSKEFSEDVKDFLSERNVIHFSIKDFKKIFG